MHINCVFIQDFQCVMMSSSALTNLDILRYADRVKLANFRGVYMRDTLPRKCTPHNECGVVNLNTSQQPGSHWVCYFKDDDRLQQHQRRIYFDSYGQITPIEIQKYLKTKAEFEENSSVIQRNTDIVQGTNTSECGHLCLIVLTALSKGVSFQQVINTLRERHNNGYS